MKSGHPGFRQPLLGSISLGSLSIADSVNTILEAALEAVNPFSAATKTVWREGNILRIRERSFDLESYRKIFLVGFGKAAYPMTSALEEILEDRFSQAIILTKEGYLPTDPSSHIAKNTRIYEAGHPVPDLRGVKATQELVRLFEKLDERDLVICLISGGGSALLTAPVQGVNMDDFQEITTLLLRSGATINEINAIRKHLDMVKGGGLARLIAPATVIALILSDVIGDSLDVIASGPTVADRSTFEECWSIIQRYNLIDKAPESIILTIRKGLSGEMNETPKPGDSIFQKGLSLIIGSNYSAAKEAAEKAKQLGFHTLLLTTYLQGEAREAGKMIAAIARQIVASGEPLKRPACVILGGETTVTVQGEGKGGRNLEIGLGSVAGLDGLPEILLATLATDGGDGPTDAAGAIVTGETKSRATENGLDPNDFLKRNDAYHFFERLQDLLITGPTQTNVNDLAFLFAF